MTGLSAWGRKWIRWGGCLLLGSSKLTGKVSWILSQMSFPGHSWGVGKRLWEMWREERPREDDGEELWRLHSVGPFQTLKPRGLAILGCAGMRGQMLSHLPSSYEVPLWSAVLVSSSAPLPSLNHSCPAGKADLHSCNRIRCLLASDGFSDGRTPEAGGGNAGSTQQCPWVLETTSPLYAKGC